MNEEIKACIEAYHAKTAEGFGSVVARLDALETKMNRPGAMAGPVGPDMERRAWLASDEAKAFVAYLRSGQKSGELKAFEVGSGSGQYAVPSFLASEIARMATNISPIRSLARVVPAAGADFRMLVSRQNATAAWTNEAGTRAEQSTPDLHSVSPPGGEVYSILKASSWFVNDAAIDVPGFLVENASLQFARAEGLAFVGGDGTAKPRGFTTYPTAATGDATRPFGTIEHVPSGAASDFATSNPADVLFTMVAKLKSEYRNGASWVMNSATMARVRTFKAATTGDYLLRDGLNGREPPSLLGYPITIAEDMPDVGAGSLPIAFGNWRSAYLIADVGALGIVVDPITEPGFVKWYLSRRVHGALLDSAAVKVLKIGTT